MSKWMEWKFPMKFIWMWNFFIIKSGISLAICLKKVIFVGCT